MSRESRTWFPHRLQRHSDHHAHPVGVTTHCAVPDVPQLSAGLRPVTIVCAAVPLERAIVERRVPDYYHGNDELMHIPITRTASR